MALWPNRVRFWTDHKTKLHVFEPAKLAEYVRDKLNLALSLACHGEQERRSCHWASAEEYQRQWEEVIAEVKRLLPLVRKNGVSLFATGNSEQSPQKRR